AMALAHDLELALLQRDCPAPVRMRQAQPGEHVRMAVEEIRVRAEVVADDALGQSGFGFRVLAHSSISPSKTVSAGPVRVTDSPAQWISSFPPRVRTSTAASSRPRRIPETTAAQAPVPQARVSPTPRSQTRSLASPRPRTCM